MIALVLAAAAQEPPVDGETGPMEVVVWGELAIDRARDELVKEIQALGYTLARRDGDAVVLKPPRAWMGKVRVSADGTLDFGRPLIGVGTLPDEAWVDDPRHGTDDLRTPEVEAGAGVTLTGPPSKAKLDTVRARVLQETREERANLRAVMARTQIEAIADGVPARLDATWTAGEPLEPGAPILASADERRAAILEFWATRAETPEGRRVLDAVDAWIGQVLWPAAPPTEEELARWDARRSDGRKLPRPR